LLIDAKRDLMTRLRLPRLAWAIGSVPRAIATTMVALLLAGAAPAHAQAPGTVFLEELTWTELRDLIAAGKTTILVPIGGTEQNAPQMVLGKHNFRSRALAAKIAAQLGNALVAPEIAYVPEGNLDPPSGHIRFPGTITLPDQVLARLLEYAVRSLRQAGFRDIFATLTPRSNLQRRCARVVSMPLLWRARGVDAVLQDASISCMATFRCGR
jgi:creatinine amidohydrolase/Fe(II)-dependent formamide hydrolase-like protein